MANFALESSDPIGELISSVNYLLATTQTANTSALLSNVLIANTANGEITTTVDPNYISYLYQFLDIRYADSPDGTLNFSQNPTGRYYFGVRNSTTSNIIYQNVTVVTAFTSSDTWLSPNDVGQVQYLVVGGGGAGGGGGQGGGGGGGAVAAGNVAIAPSTNYTITVGAGATPSNQFQSNGSNSSFAYTSNAAVVIAALGGGGGGGEFPSGAAASIARNGGSGGGGSHPYFVSNSVNGFNSGANLAGANSIQVSTYGYGFGSNGGAGRGQQNGTYGGITSSDYILVGGGGGGANVAGSDWRFSGLSSNISAIFGGNGGAGFESNITNTVSYFGGGGGGGVRVVNSALGLSNYVSGAGGQGGGQGNIARLNANVSGGGTVNTGGGGAGVMAGPSAAVYAGGAGGSGFVALRYDTTIATSGEPASNNPADYIWTQVVGGFGTTNLLWYAVYGGRQIVFVVSNAAPSSSYLTPTSGVSLDLDRVTVLASKVVVGDNIVNKTITGNLVADATITGNLLVAGTITGNLIAANTITGNLIAANTITANNIAAGTITADKLAANVLTVNTVVSTGATFGSNASAGFWLDGNTGNARFGNSLNVGNNLTVGANAIIGQFATIGTDAVIGSNLLVGVGATIGNFANVGNFVFVGNNLTVANAANIGTNLTVGANAVIGNNLIVGVNANIGGNLLIGANANIGNNLRVGNTTTIGSNLVVGANANIGGNLIVGNNATIGSNLTVTGIITSGNLNNNTVNTNTIVANAVTNSNGVSVSGTVYTNNAVTLSNLGLVEAGGSLWFLYESPQFYVANSGVRLTFQDTNVVVGISGQSQVQGNVYVNQDFSPFVTSQLFRKTPTGNLIAVAPQNYSLISTVFAGNQSIAASQVINDFYSYTVNIIEAFTTNGASQTHEFAWAYSVGALVAGYGATGNGNIRGTNPTVSVTQFKR